VLTGAHEHTFRPTNERPCGSPASPDARAVPPTRPTRPLPQPWPLAAPAAPCCRALTPAHCPRCTLPTAPVPPARATALKKEVLAATTTAAETWCMHTAKPARDCQGAGYKARAQATEDARPTRSHQRSRAPAGRDADRVDIDALDLVGDVGSRSAPAGLEEVVEGHLRSAPYGQAASRAAGRRSRVSGRRVQTARVRGGGWGTVGDNAAQAAAGHSQAHQTTWYGRKELQTAKNDSS
jgi:hypothetical protein